MELHQGTIWVVDDEPDNFDVIELLLAQENYRLGYASSGLELLRRLKKSQPDVILLDVMMPEMDGLEVCRHLKAHAVWCRIPIVMITALNTTTDLTQCLDAGADDFISKPVSGAELRARVRSMMRIKHQYDDLQATLQLREDMSNMMVHDFRNPLTGILLSCDNLSRTPLSEGQLQKVEQIVNLGFQLQSMLDDLLLMAKLESGKMLLNYQESDLVLLGFQVIQDFEAAAAQRNIQLLTDLPPPGSLFKVDATILRRILDNLLSNAIKFSPKGSSITLKVAYPKPTQSCIFVCDQGKGIKAELKAKVFEKFEIGESVADLSQIGLGLAFCKMAIAAHGGTITVADNNPTGTIFKIKLPSAGAKI